MNDLRIKYTKPTIIEVTYVDSDVVLVQCSPGTSVGGETPGGGADPFSNKGATSDSDDNSGNGEGFEYNPFQ